MSLCSPVIGQLPFEIETRNALSAVTDSDSNEAESDRTRSIQGEAQDKDQQDASGDKEGFVGLVTGTTLESKNKNGRNTWLYMIGAWAIAVLFAVLHLVFFEILDGKDITAAPANIQQSHVTAISLLLATGFRTAITSSIGISITQYMWRLFRLKAFEIRLIEDLFQIRSNVLGLLNPNIVRHAPFIFLTALVSWLVPLATVYPPSALTIQNEPRWALVTVDASVVNPAPKEGEGYWDSKGGLGVRIFSSTGSNEPIEVKYKEPKQTLFQLTRSVLTIGQVVPITPIKSENSSYQVQFEAPIVRCQNDTVTNVTLPLSDHNTTYTHFSIKWNSPSLTEWGPPLFEEESNDNANQLNLTITAFDEPLVYYFHDAEGHPENLEGVSDNTTWFAIAERHRMTCTLYTSLYTTVISYVKGVQTVSLSTAYETPLEFPLRQSLLWDEDKSQVFSNTTLDKNSQEFRDWEMRLSNWRYKTNSLAILDSLFKTMAYENLKSASPNSTRSVVATHRFPNGTEVNVYRIPSGSGPAPTYNSRYTILRDTNFNTHRFNWSNCDDTGFAMFPSSCLDITEEIINSALANISISAISLGQWARPVQVNNTEHVNIYSFSHPINIFLPYGLCLASAFVSMAFGLKALNDNGVPAADGGFLQVMMTTTGDTAMSRAVGSGCVGGGKDNLPGEFLKMKVRFGELINARDTAEDGGRRAGFGTMEETTALRRRMGHGREMEG